MSAAKPVSYTRSGPGDAVATIRLERPEARNALDTATKDALLDALRTAARDDEVRAVVLAGAGRTFCAGQDLKEHAAALAAADADADTGGDADDADARDDLSDDVSDDARDDPGARTDADPVWETVARHYAGFARALLTMPKPVVAAVNGVAAGAGASLALACDFRVLADDAGFAMAFSTIGLPCDTGMSWTLQRIVGYARALDLLVRPRTLGAAEARTLGLATTVVPAPELDRAAHELADELAAGPTQAYACIKSALLRGSTSGLEDALAYEHELMRRAGATLDHRRAVEAFLARERPVFEGR